MLKENIQILVLGLDDLKLTGISRNGCAIVTIGDTKPVLISRSTFTRLLNQPGYRVKGMIVADAEPFNGKTWHRLHTLKM